MSYVLNIKFINGEEKELVLSAPHTLTPDNSRPAALVYKDAAGLLHNIPFTSIMDFWFSVEAYTKCEAKDSPLRRPTPGCNCEACVKATLEIKNAAKGI